MADMTQTVDMDAVVAALKARGFTAYVEQTGGGTATIYAGPTYYDPDEQYDRYAAAAGPGWFEGFGWTIARGNLADFALGHDDNGFTDPIIPTTNDPERIAELIARVVACYVQYVYTGEHTCRTDDDRRTDTTTDANGVTAVRTFSADPEPYQYVLDQRCVMCGTQVTDDDRGPLYDTVTDDGTPHTCPN